MSFGLGLGLGLGLGRSQVRGGESPDMILVYAIPDPNTNIELAIQANSGWFSAGQEVVIDWGDGSNETVSDTGGSTYIGHTYASAGTYTIKISGSMKMYGRTSNVFLAGQTLLTRVDSFGKLGITSFWRAFGNCTGLMSVPKTLPSTVTNMAVTFENCSNNAFNPDVSNWDVSEVTNMDYMFSGCRGDAFNPNVSNWNVSKVRYMHYMFYGCRGAAFNPDVSKWDVRNVTNMEYMFASCSGNAFNPDVSNWDVRNVTNMEYMFYDCSGAEFNPDISNWDVSNVTNMGYMFRGCSGAAFNPDVSKWNVSNVTNMTLMFQGCRGDAFNPNVSNWNVSKVTSMAYMFRYCSGAAFSPDMKSWTLKTGVSTAYMFTGSRTQSTTWLDELLVAWAANPEQGDDITIDFSPNSFSETTEGEPIPAVAAALATLNGKGWNITTANPYPAP